MPPALGAQRLSHWTAKEVPGECCFKVMQSLLLKKRCGAAAYSNKLGVCRPTRTLSANACPPARFLAAGGGRGALLGGPLTLSLLCTITHPSPTTQDPSFFSTNLNATT